MNNIATRIGAAMVATGALLLFTFGLLRRPAQAQGAGVLYVASGADCGTAQPCYGHPQDAVDDASDGDMIKVAAGTYTGVRPRMSGELTATVTVTQSVYVSKTVTIRGGYLASDWLSSQPETRRAVLDAAGQGRVIYVTGRADPTFEGIEITGGAALGGEGGGVLVVRAKGTFSACHVYGNSAHRGGGLHIDDHSDVRLIANVISDNSAAEHGGGLYVDESTAVLERNTISGNIAAQGGGGLALGDRSTCTLITNSMVNNTAHGDGGAVLLRSGGSAWLRGNSITGNTAHDDGGGLAARDASEIHLTDDVVSSNQAQNDGGAIDLSTGSSATLSDAYLTSNMAEDNGGGLAAENSQITVSQSSVTGNTASGLGGGLYLALSSTASVLNSSVEGNTAAGGGGLCMMPGSSATLTRNSIAQNRAFLDGGGMHLKDQTAATLRSNTIVNNTSGDDGGGLYLEASQVELVDNDVLDNHAGGDGGAFAVRRWGQIALSQDRVLGNVSDDDGGAFYIAAGAPFTLTNSVIAQNRAIDTGGGLWVVGTPLGRSSGLLRHNTIADNGDVGLSVGISATLQVVNSIIVKHSVGVFVIEGSSVDLEATLWGNGEWANVQDEAGLGSISIGTVNVWGDPRFVSPAEGDYHISEQSAAVDAGLDAGVYVDLDGNARPGGGGFDIGADEYCVMVPTLYLPVLGKSFSP